MDTKPHLSPLALRVLVVFCLLVTAANVYQAVVISSLSGRVDALSQELSTTGEIFSNDTKRLSRSYKDLHKETKGLSVTLSNTENIVNQVKTKVGGVEAQVGDISGTVSTLKKLSEIDPQLLKKYSKVYFLNENYTPKQMTRIPDDFVYSTARTEVFLAEIMPHLISMSEDAAKDGVKLYVKSAYRSFSEQKSLKSTYSVTYGTTAANKFSADQGFSEHQLGTTVDVITTGLGGQLDGFGETKAYEWMKRNAYKYGFVLSYPKNNAYYVYEPWHWRYVGVTLATLLHNTNRNFYDLDQREIDKYLINFFD